MLGFIFDDGKEVFEAQIENATMISILVTILVLVVGFYLLRGFGLFMLAKKSEDKSINSTAFLAFIPIVWVYLASKLAGRINLFGKEIKVFAILLTIIFVVSQVALITGYVIKYIPLVRYYFDGGKILINMTDFSQTDEYVYDSTFILVGANQSGYSSSLANFLKILSRVSTILTFIADIMLLFVYIALFRKYWPLHSMGASLLSIVGLFPVMVFLIRKKEPIDYETFLKERYNQMYGGYNRGGFNNYNQNNNYNANDNDDPFDNFNNNVNNNSSSDDPFEEFGGNNKNKDEK